jgi:Tfp pilus assembly protein PilW
MRKRGLTFVELIVAVGISTVLMATVFTITLMARQAYEASTIFVDICGGARIGMDWISRDLRWSSQVLSNITIDTQTYATADNELVLEIPSIDGSGDVITGTSDYVVYHLNTTHPARLERILDADSTSSRSDEAHVITNNMNALFFSSGGTGLGSIADYSTLTQVEAALATRKTASSGRVVGYSLNSVIKLRNK